MTTLATFLTDLTETQKSITALAGAVAVGATMMSIFYGFTGLPDRVHSLEVQEKVVQEQVATLEVKLDQAICLLTLPENVERETALRTCQI